MIYPTLNSNRIKLVPFDEHHLTERYVSWLNDPTIVRYSELRHTKHNTETARNYLREMRDKSNYYWAIETNTLDSTHIGNITIIRDNNNRIADASILMGDRSFHGRGYGLESWKTACRYLLDIDGVRKIRAGTMASNTPMRRLMDSAGMVFDGVWRRHLLFEGQEMDVVFAAIFSKSE